MNESNGQVVDSDAGIKESEKNVKKWLTMVINGNTMTTTGYWKYIPTIVKKGELKC